MVERGGEGEDGGGVEGGYSVAGRVAGRAHRGWESAPLDWSLSITMGHTKSQISPKGLLWYDSIWSRMNLCLAGWYSLE